MPSLLPQQRSIARQTKVEHGPVTVKTASLLPCECQMLQHRGVMRQAKT